MNKDAYWFKHDSNAKDDPKCVLLIEQLGLEGYGIYWVLIEMLRDQPNYRYPLALIPAIARRYNTTAEKMKTVIQSYGLFDFDEEDFFFSSSLRERMALYDGKREQARLAAQVRWGTNADAMRTHSRRIADALPAQSNSNAIREDKTREDKIREDEIREDEPAADNEGHLSGHNESTKQVPYEKIKDLFNNICTSYSQVRLMSERRKETVRARFKQYGGIDTFEELFKTAEASDFLKGKNNRKWKADFDWLIKEANMTKVLEGRYNNTEEKQDAGVPDLGTFQTKTVLPY